MDPSLKLSIFLAFLLFSGMIGLYMILARTLANLEYALERIEELVEKELNLALKVKEREKDQAKKSVQNPDKHARNDLLLNIPFMDRLGKDKGKTSGTPDKPPPPAPGTPKGGK
jgi:hypothetical protein